MANFWKKLLARLQKSFMEERSQKLFSIDHCQLKERRQLTFHLQMLYGGFSNHSWAFF